MSNLTTFKPCFDLKTKRIEYYTDIDTLQDLISMNPRPKASSRIMKFANFIRYMFCDIPDYERLFNHYSEDEC